MELRDKTFALLVANQFEDAEALYPYYRLQEAGARVEVLGAVPGVSVASKHGYPLPVDSLVSRADWRRFDGVIIPGGYSPDVVRSSREALDFVRALHTSGRLIAAICHAGWVLASAGIIQGRSLTSWPSIKDDLVNAGALWVDEPVVVDGNLVTSRRPADLPVFMRGVIGFFAHHEVHQSA